MQFGPRVDALIERGVISAESTKSIVEEICASNRQDSIASGEVGSTFGQSNSSEPEKKLKRSNETVPFAETESPTLDLSGSTIPQEISGPVKRTQIWDAPVNNWDRYEFLSLLGEGGMGKVYKAYDPSLRRNVALKFIRGEDPGMRRRFVQEAQAQARVNHPNVCRVYEIGKVEDKQYIAMQFIEGRNLANAKRNMSLRQKIVLMSAISPKRSFLDSSRVAAEPAI